MNQMILTFYVQTFLCQQHKSIYFPYFLNIAMAQVVEISLHY